MAYGRRVAGNAAHHPQESRGRLRRLRPEATLVFSMARRLESHCIGEVGEVFRTVLRLTAWFWFLSGAALPALGQTAQISGQVTDAQTAAVMGADVHVVNLETLIKVDAKTDAAVAFTVPNLPPGRYHVSIEAQVFSPFNSEEVTLTTGQREVVSARVRVVGVN